MIELSKYSCEGKDKWDDFVSKSKNGVFLFYRDYIEYHADRFKEHSLVFLKKRKIIAIFPANEDGLNIISHGGLTFGSLIMSKKIRMVEVLDIFEKIKSYYADLGFSRIIYKAIPTIFHSYPAEEDLYALFRNNALTVKRDISSVIKIENALRFSPTKRQAINKGLENRIVVSESDNFDDYWMILEDVLLKHNTKPTHTKEEIIKLKALFNDNIRLFEARKDGGLLAGVVIYDYGKLVHTQYMANSVNGRKMGALDIINHYLLTKVFQGKEYFSFGTSNEQMGRKLNLGLIQQKEMMGGRGISVDSYQILL